ncbi:MAG: hypothetical protein EPO62_08875 [Candidatus Nitrosotenuis sp.]|nr:MAG: hypothetical protein EPO62_08875 [Candidatus Nitrosotenuis sp.]
MKFLLILILSIIVVVPAFAVPLSDRTGLKTKFDVDVGNSTYVVETVANFNIDDVTFYNDTLVFQISSGLQDNLLEMQIPQNITAGAIHLFLDKQEVAPKILSDQKISFVTLEFQGNGTHVLEVKSDYTTKPPEPQAVPGEPVNPVAVFLVAAVAAIAAGIAMMYRKKKAIR